MIAHHPQHGRKPNRKRGAAIMAVLWVVGLLLLLITTTSTVVLQDVEFDITRTQIFRARLLAESGLSLGMHPDIKPNDPLLHQRLPGGEELHVMVMGEDGRFNPNALLLKEDRDTLRRIMRFWGIENLMMADQLINNLLDWVDPDPYERSPGAEARAYRRPGFPFNRPFRSVEEMSLVLGMDAVDAVYPDWRNWFSVYASGVLDLNEAEPELISAITGADLVACRQFRARRLGADGIPNTQDDLPALDLSTALARLGVSGNTGQYAGVLSVQSQSRRILAQARVGDFEREIGLVMRGIPGQGGAGEILWLGER